MSDTAPARNDAFHLLRQDLYGHLDEAEFLAMKCVGWSDRDADIARELIPELVDTIRQIVLLHSTAPTGICDCGEDWPCRTVSVIRAELKEPDSTIRALYIAAEEERAQP
ncbi:hypothetical protein [Haloechinothrix sp. LS1_15]|uniref:hypothetical protein n=1 Tax=Haloechinothrix sp. LS1_15 TaxID=2652248 RepID=UPI0029485991|nr:hypothetical protein [Haloechinothrix sp. LS1_15]MDV6011234.1 hypothetical protein [Haloechinothrix sp. LS1_15]